MSSQKNNVSLGEIAKVCGVSKATVSMALKGDSQISAKTRKMIKSQARRMGFRKDPVVSKVMSQLRHSKTRELRGALAIIHLVSMAYSKTHPFIVSLVNRAFELGYGVDHLFYASKEDSMRSLVQTVSARGIKGVFIFGGQNAPKRCERVAKKFSELPYLVNGYNPLDHDINYVRSDYHHATLGSVEQAVAHGYERPAFAFDLSLETTIEHLHVSGYLGGLHLFKPMRGEILIHDLPSEIMRKDLSNLKDWILKMRPDCILGDRKEIEQCVRMAGFKIPEEVGLIDIHRNSIYETHWSGMTTPHEELGKCAADFLVSQVELSRVSDLESTASICKKSEWFEGSTLRLRS